MINHKIFVAGYDRGSADWITGSLTSDIAKATLVLFTGGTDINSSIYGKKAHEMAQSYDHKRDALEKAVFSEAIELGLPMLGICRGAQLLCALSGGSLVQHSWHPGGHPLDTFDGKRIMVNSCHHQRAFPYTPGCKHKLIAWAPMGTSPFNWGETFEEDMTGQPEAEIVYYPETKSLGIQSHPEWLWPPRDNAGRDSLLYMHGILDKMVDGDL